MRCALCSPLEEDVERIRKRSSYRLFTGVIYPAIGALFCLTLATTIVYITVVFFRSVCQQPLKLWLLVAAIGLFVHGFAFLIQLPYGIYKMQRKRTQHTAPWEKSVWRRRLSILGDMVCFIAVFFWIVSCSWGSIWLFSDYQCPPQLRWATVALVALLGSANAFISLPYFCWIKRGVFPCIAACFCCRTDDLDLDQAVYGSVPDRSLHLQEDEYEAYHIPLLRSAPSQLQLRDT